MLALEKGVLLVFQAIYIVEMLWSPQCSSVGKDFVSCWSMSNEYIVFPSIVSFFKK